MIKVQYFTFNAFRENTYLLIDSTKECVVIDPGCYVERERTLLQKFIAEHGLKVKLLLNTHCHIDHVLGNQFIKNTYQVPLLIHDLEAENLRSVQVYAPIYGFEQYEPSEPDQFISEKDLITFGESTLQVLFVPGHSIGHLAFYCPEANFCINGDVLFNGSIGRSDLPGGNHDRLLQSIYHTMYLLPDETVIYCGHGDPTTIKKEKFSNPFCAITT
ncbi:MAG: MBL fold metallo-hydrolase [Thermoflexibacter sp.]|jgi:glyoxylase-like metal-dependent hydrolase (beta-lactamase superfamily II)|nr:MBL fold metallo-hydrolase [Thermoflexibacter sp.]